jgi:AcrR family transcriptional regulator
MSAAEPFAQTLPGPKRADARRNYERVLVAAREAFAEGGESTALEEIARRAGVGIGTLHRHFPTRQALRVALDGLRYRPVFATARRRRGPRRLRSGAGPCGSNREAAVGTSWRRRRSAVGEDFYVCGR